MTHGQQFNSTHSLKRRLLQRCQSNCIWFMRASSELFKIQG